ncbi:NusG domain II-containing protein [Thermoanaerobacterium sp. DL9XJH110]|uniref:NusG domain II-containing protein n=1 Tax=Thermoanaerobacterium sp. DL9XJH110 TaxID=3386643 RepID=UPI003BB4F349
MLTKGDRILIAFILLSAFLIFAGFHVYGFSGSKTYAIIEINGQPYQKISLGENGPRLRVKVPVPLGENIVEVDRNRVRMMYADCPDKDCVRQGWISRPGQMLVCLPNRMVVKIESDRGTRNPDMISF